MPEAYSDKMLEIWLLKGPSNRPLTTGIDTVSGAATDDAIAGIVGTGATVTALDVINGGDGSDTLNLVHTDGAIAIPASATISSVEVVNVRSSHTSLTLDLSGTNISGVTNLNSTQSAAVTLTAAKTTDVSVTGATGAITVDGGKAVTVSAVVADQAVTIGNTTDAAGNISVTHTKQGTGDIDVDGAAAVSVTASAVSTGKVTVGAAGDAVVITSTGAAYVAGTAATMGKIDVTGGSTVAITQVATSSSAAAADDGSAANRTQSIVAVDAANTAKSVSVTQTAALTAVNAVAAVAKVDEVQTVTFASLATGQSLTIGGLTYTATAANSAAQVAAAFANLATGATTGANVLALGRYSGSWTAEHSSSAAVNTGTTATPVWKVTFTGSGAATDLIVQTTAVAGAGTDTIVGTNDDVATANAADFSTSVTTAGVNAVAAVTGVMGVVNGTVAISDTGTKDTLASVTLNGFAATTIGSDALSGLSLSNSVAGVTITNATTKALSLNANGYGNSTTAPALDIGGTYTSLAVDTGSVAGSDFTLTGGGLTSLTVSGSKALDLNATALAALKTLTVSGAAGLTASGLTSATITSYDLSASSGANTLTVNATTATYAGGSGVDKVTLSATAPVKSVNLGDGNDTLTLAAGTTSSTGTLSGGDGTDTLAIAAADAATASADAVFEGKISSFERLSLGAVGATATVDLANLDEISYVTVGAVTAALNIDNMAIGGTLVLTGANTATTDVDFVDATGTADNINLALNVDGDINFGTVDISLIESVAIVATDSSATTINTATIAITDAALKSVAISGNANVSLSAGAAVTTIDGSAMTGKLTATSNTVATTITGGSGADSLTANVTGSTLVGGAGGDTLTASANLVTLTGGAGSDTFDVSYVVSNLNSYATITDFSAGDKLKVGGTGANVDFVSAKITLASTASFADYANAAVAAAGADDVAWFQFGGDTYLVQDLGADSSAANGFINGQDTIVKLAGTIDLSLLTFNSTALTFA